MKQMMVCALALTALTGLADEAAERRANTVRLQAEIDSAAAKGGGRVTVEKGVHPCGTLYLKSNVELHLADGAVLQGGGKSEDYDDAIPDRHVYRYKGMRPFTDTRKAFVFAQNATNVAITGKGMIDGRGPDFFDRSTCLWGRFWAKPACYRVRMVVFINCHGIRFADTTFKDPSVWTMWLRFCENVEVSRIRIDAEQKIVNSDGIDFDGCRHVRVGDSYFRTGDDSIVLRAIRDAADPKREVVCEDVVVTNCVLESSCNGVRVGCPSDDTVRDALFRDIVFRGHVGITAEQPATYLTEGDRGFLRTANLVFENWRIEKCVQPIQIFVSGGVTLRDFGHMTFRNIQAPAGIASTVQGGPQTVLRDVRFENVRAGIPTSGKMPWTAAVIVK